MYENQHYALFKDSEFVPFDEKQLDTQAHVVPKFCPETKVSSKMKDIMVETLQNAKRIYKDGGALVT
jgi:hypothetical protein